MRLINYYYAKIFRTRLMAIYSAQVRYAINNFEPCNEHTLKIITNPNDFISHRYRSVNTNEEIAAFCEMSYHVDSTKYIYFWLHYLTTINEQLHLNCMLFGTALKYSVALFCIIIWRGSNCPFCPKDNRWVICYVNCSSTSYIMSDCPQKVREKLADRIVLVWI